MEDLDKAIQRFQESLDATPVDHPARADRLQSLGSGYRDRYQTKRMQADLDAAIQQFQESIRLTPDNHPELARRLQSLGAGYHERYQRQGLEADLDAAIQKFQESISLTSDDHPKRTSRPQSLGSGYEDRYQRNRAETDLDAAIRMFLESIRLTSDDHPERARRLQCLGNGYGDRYQRKGALADLDEAIWAVSEALDAIPQDRPDRTKYLNNLESRLGDRYSKTGAMIDLEEAIGIIREAVDATPENHPHRAKYLNNLGSRLSDRCSRTGTLAGIEESDRAERVFFDVIPKNHPNWAYENASTQEEHSGEPEQLHTLVNTNSLDPISDGQANPKDVQAMQQLVAKSEEMRISGLPDLSSTESSVGRADSDFSYISGSTLDTSDLPIIGRMQKAPYLKASDTMDDTISVISALTTAVPKEEVNQVIEGFVQAILDGLKARRLRASLPDSSQEFAKRILLAKLRCYGREVVRGTGKTISLKRKRNAAKIIIIYGDSVVGKFVKFSISPNLTQTEQRPRMLLIAEDDPFERITDWQNNQEKQVQDSLCDPIDAEMITQDSGSETMSDTTSDDEPVQPEDHQAIQEHLINRKEFGTLQSAFGQLIQHFWADTIELVKFSVLANTKALDGQCRAEFRVEWDILDFFESYGYELQGLGCALAITGSLYNAQMTTIDSYLKQTWPIDSSAVLEALQNAFIKTTSGSQKGVDSECNRATGCVEEIDIGSNIVLVRAAGSTESLYTVGQQLAELLRLVHDSWRFSCFCVVGPERVLYVPSNF